MDAAPKVMGTAWPHRQGNLGAIGHRDNVGRRLEILGPRTLGAKRMEKPEKTAGPTVAAGVLPEGKTVEPIDMILAGKFDLHKALIMQQDGVIPAVAVMVAYAEGVRGLKKRLTAEG